MRADQRAHIEAGMMVGERRGIVRSYYAYAPGDIGVCHTLDVEAEGIGWAHVNLCTAAMVILADALVTGETVSHSLIRALRKVR